MRQQHAPQHFLIGNSGARGAHEIREAPVVVIADEGRELPRRPRAALVEGIPLEEPGQNLGPLRAGDGRAHRRRKSEIEHRGQPVDPRVDGERPGVRALAVGLTEDMEVGNAPRLRAREHGRHEGLPELRVHVLRGVDAEAVDPVLVDPGAVDVDESLEHPRVLGHQIVEPEEVAEGRALAAEGRVAAVVVVDRVVEPIGNLEVLVAPRHVRGVGVVGAREPCEVLGGLVRRVVSEEPAVDRLAAETAAPLIRELGVRAIGAAGHRALAVGDHIRGVVDDDVEVELHAARVHRVCEGAEVVVGSKVRIHAGEVRDPVAVVAGGLPPLRPLNGLVPEDRRYPDRARSELLDVVEPRDQALEIPAVVEALVGGIEAGREAVAPEAAAIVGRISVLEAIGQEEIDDFVLQRARPESGGPGRIRAGAGSGCRLCDGENTGRQRQQRYMNPHEPVGSER